MLKANVESILFIVARPLTIKKLSDILGAKKDEVSQVIDELAEKYNQEGSGLRVLRQGNDVQMATSPETSKVVQDFLKDETTGELTKPSLETLTIIAYRGPIAKAELEQIRGVNCSLILRNLMLRGLVEVDGEHGNPGARYSVTLDFLRFLGVSSVEELPDYGKLSSHENIVRVLEEAQEQVEQAALKAEGQAVAPAEDADAPAEEEPAEDEPTEDVSDEDGPAEEEDEEETPPSAA
jgi:segregation and condensation protein B